MTTTEQINDKIKQEAHGREAKEKRELLQAQRDFMRNPRRETAAMRHSFAVALSRSVQQQRQAPSPQQPLPKDTAHKGLDGGVVKITACVDNGDGSFDTKAVLVQGTKEA